MTESATLTINKAVQWRERLLSMIPEDVPGAPPVIDFSPFYENDVDAKAALVDQVRDACLEKGFFQIIGHGVPEDLQSAMFEQSADFFSLPLEQKEKYDKANNPNKLGYECLRSQNFEGKTAGDLKEGFFFGRDLPPDHPYVQQGRIHCGQNVYPTEVSDQERFKAIVNKYHQAMTSLAENILKVIAMTLNLDKDYFQSYCHEPAAVLRPLHYPPQPADASEDERGIGAHTDFGGVTILLQDDVGGLQVFDAPSKTWIDVKPTPGAFVVNLGNMMMRWSNDIYVSNLHRVINKSGKERYSIPFFYSGNPDYMIDCLPGCEDASGKCKYPPIRGEDWIFGRHSNTFREAKGVEELSGLAKIA
ncbi:hypothetical protein LTR67_000617 [Exophiala xenobiotica]